MKIQIYSDLHLEFAGFDPTPSDADLVILAGDIDIKSRGVSWANDTFQCSVIYVCGNHEYYGGHIDHTLRKMKEAAAPHIHVLENEALILNQTRFWSRQRGQITRRLETLLPRSATLGNG